jgi:hypothetical protein
MGPVLTACWRQIDHGTLVTSVVWLYVLDASILPSGRSTGRVLAVSKRMASAYQSDHRPVARHRRRARDHSRQGPASATTAMWTLPAQGVGVLSSASVDAAPDGVPSLASRAGMAGLPTRSATPARQQETASGPVTRAGRCR